MTFSKLWQRLDLNLVLISLLSVFAFAPLAHPAFFQSHSGFLPVFNLYDLERNLWGSWGWVPMVGVGLDLLSGEGPFPYGLAEFFRWLGVGGVEAIKAVYLLGFVASGLATYLLGKEVYGPGGGLVAALVYVYLPYHLATVYVRGAFAEAWAFVLYPLILLCWEKYMGRQVANLPRGRAWLWGILAVLLYAALALTNVGLALVFAPFLFIYVLLLAPSRSAKGQALGLLVMGLVLGLLLIVPSVMRYGLSIDPRADSTQHFLYPFQLLSASWGYGASTPDWTDTLPLRLGLVATGLTLLAGLLLLRREEVDMALRRKVGFFVVGAIVMICLMLYPASFLWQASRVSLLLEYPWQLLALVGLAMSLASGATVVLARQLARFPWQVVLITLVIVASYSYLMPRFTDLQVGGSPMAILGDEVALLAYRREGPLLHGAAVRLTLYWQSLRPMETDYTVFVHVVDAEGTIWGQSDAMPVDGERPTSSWELGEIIEDEYDLKTDVEGPREGYVIELGMYVQSTGERLRVSGGGTVVILE
jgi:hypothetical protein